jgi:hypothetical protein
MDNYYIYVFIRQDLTVPEQLVHSNHASAHMANLYGLDEIPNLVVIGVPHQTSMNRVQQKLKSYLIDHYAWTDPDQTELGVTAITTVPLSPSVKELFSKYKLYTIPT